MAKTQRRARMKKHKYDLEDFGAEVADSIMNAFESCDNEEECIIPMQAILSHLSDKMPQMFQEGIPLSVRFQLGNGILYDGNLHQIVEINTHVLFTVVVPTQKREIIKKTNLKGVVQIPAKEFYERALALLKEQEQKFVIIDTKLRRPVEDKDGIMEFKTPEEAQKIIDTIPTPSEYFIEDISGNDYEHNGD